MRSVACVERPLQWRSLAPVAAVAAVVAAASGQQLLPGRRRAAARASWHLLVRYGVRLL